MQDFTQIANLVVKLQAGDQKAAADLYQSQYEDIYYFIFKNVQHPELAADLTQDAFIEILQTIGNLKDPTAFVAWSRQIAYHRCTAYFKKRHDLLADENEDGQTVFDFIAEERDEFIPDQALDKEDLKQTIQAMINELPPEQRSAIQLRYFDELSVKDIADIQGVTEGTVKSRLNYGRKAIKQAVEAFEEKNGIKLRCVGIVPLLLWLFHSYGAIGAVSAGAGAAGAGAATAGAVTAAGSVSSASGSAAPILGKGLKAGIKKLGKLFAKKWIAGVTAAAVISGGVAATVLLQEEPEEKNNRPKTWFGYGTDANRNTKRFDLSVDLMTETTIRGHLEVSILYSITHKSDFEGTGTVHDDTIVYTITFETPAVLGVVITYTYDQMELVYYKEDKTFSFDDIYRVSMEKTDAKKAKTLAKNRKWSGYGKDDFYIMQKENAHLFEMDVYKMTETEISGKFILTYNGNIDHESEFVGRGAVSKGVYYFEVKLETPRIVKNIVESKAETFWLKYDPEADSLTISPSGRTFPSLELYHAVLNPEK